MKIKFNENAVSLSEIGNFSIAQILECGQCFRFERIDLNHYKIIAHKRVLEIKEENGIIYLNPCTKEEFSNIWYNYFDLGRDYSKVKREISQHDSIMEAAIAYAPGIRVLNQEFWECCISFIISQNNRIPMIKKVIENICKKYGTPIENKNIEGNFFSFPYDHQLKHADIPELIELKTGFRAKYIIDAVRKSLNGMLNEDELKSLDTVNLRKRLTSVYGIGNKVADCTMLFGLARTDVFPTDVWIKRIISQLYYNGTEISLKELQEFAANKWGNNAGLAQQYLFHYARMNKIGA